MDKMVEILKDIQQKYVPVDHQDDKVVLQQTAFAWDQLTAARAQKSQTVRVNSKSPTDAVRGLMPLAADWDAKVKFMEVWCFDTWMCIRKCVWLYSCHHGTKQYWKMSLLPSVLLWVCNTRKQQWLIYFVSVGPNSTLLSSTKMAASFVMFVVTLT